MVSVPIPVVGFLGAGSGLVVGTLGAEYVARVTGQSGWAAVGVKGLTRGAIGLLTYLGSQKVRRPTGSFVLEMMTYGDVGGFFLDAALAMHPGGIPGLAEDLSVATRSLAVGSKQVVDQLGSLEQRARSAQGDMAQGKQTVSSSIF